jgi:hypothetical protein
MLLYKEVAERRNFRSCEPGAFARDAQDGRRNAANQWEQVVIQIQESSRVSTTLRLAEM